MRRTIFMALLAALLLAPAAAQAADPVKIIRDCEDDGVLQGNYTASELRKARSALPTDIDEYSDCRDVLSRAISAKTSKSKNKPSTNSGGGTSTPAPTQGGGGSTSPESGTIEDPAPQAREAERAAILSAPSSPHDAQAVGEAARRGEEQIQVDAKPRDPGAARLAASVGRNGLPTTMAAVLALLGAALLAAGLPLLRRRRRDVADPRP